MKNVKLHFPLTNELYVSKLSQHIRGTTAMVKTIDTAILALLLLLIIKGIWRGFKKELISLVEYGIALLAASTQLENGTRFFEKYFQLHPLFGYFVSYIVIFLAVLLILKFFVNQFLKLFRYEPSSGLLDSIGGGIFGFCLGMITVGLTVAMLRPIPIMDAVFTEKNKSLFIPLSEKFAEPIAGRFTGKTGVGSPLQKMLSKGGGEGLILPDFLKGLGSAEQFHQLTTQQQNLQQQLQENQAGQPQGAYKQALESLGIDTSKLPKQTLQEIIKDIKK
jgi:uncharacterized membrane protein required for colicin V production